MTPMTTLSRPALQPAPQFGRKPTPAEVQTVADAFGIPANTIVRTASMVDTHRLRHDWPDAYRTGFAEFWHMFKRGLFGQSGKVNFSVPAGTLASGNRRSIQEFAFVTQVDGFGVISPISHPHIPAEQLGVCPLRTQA